MATVVETEGALSFGEFELDFQHLELRHNGARVEIKPTPLRLLLYLAKRRDRTVTKRELLDTLWEGANVTDTSLANALSEARAAVGDDGTAQRVIQTWKKHGYRFVADAPSLQVPPLWSTRRRIVVWACAVVFVLTSIWLAAWWQLRSPALPPIRSIAVLPFENLSGDPKQDYFAAGMSAELISELGKLDALRVISRTSVVHYKDQQKPIGLIAEELQVDGIIEGSVMRVGNRVRVTVQLVDARTESRLWSDAYDRELSDVLTLWRDVARSIVEQIRLELTPEEKSLLTASRLIDPGAYEAYLRGLTIASQSPPLIIPGWGPEAIGHFERAVDLDPAFAEAWAWLGVLRSILALYDPAFSPDLLPKARVATERALQLDENLGLAHVAMGWVRSLQDWDLAGAHGSFEKAVELAPNDPMALHDFAQLLIREGHSAEGLALSDRLALVDPLSLFRQAIRASLSYDAREYERAIEEFERLRELGSAWVAEDEAVAYSALGRFHKAADTHISLYRDCGPACAWQGEAMERGWAQNGWEGAMRALIAEAKQVEGFRPSVLAMLYTWVGETDEAFSSLERGYREHEPFMLFLNSFPIFDPLRTDSRMDDLLRRIGSPKLTEDPGMLAEIGRNLALAERSAEAMRHVEKAKERSPEDARLARWDSYLGLAHFAAGRYEAAAECAAAALDRSPRRYTAADARLLLASSYAHLGRLEMAEESLKEALLLWPELTVDLVPLPPYTVAGFRERYVAGLRLAGLSPQAGS